MINFLSILLISVVFYLLARVVLNDHYYGVIYNKRKSIDEFLKSHRLTYKTLASDYEAAPCEIQFSVIQEAEVGIRAFDFYRLLKKAKKFGNIDILVNKCKQVDDRYKKQEQAKGSF